MVIHYGRLNFESLSLENVIEVPRKFGFPTIRNGKICGFDTSDAKTMIEISLTDGTTKKHTIAEKGRIEINEVEGFLMGNKLFFYQHDRSNHTHTVLEFDFPTLKWSKTGIQVAGHCSLHMVNNQLVLCVCNHLSDDPNNCTLLRCQFKKVRTLASLTCEAMRRYSRYNPEFYSWFMSKLSINSKFYSL
ncbi:hypothetical protein M3Y96_01124000 [Aphelenchoides besseyi]|nr:hypothetical protein M3Y96_01124000 [Aphelenchoides besseyi]